ncbi:MAG: Uma2 family endonuclease [Chloroflexi bacterium]|nr:Uma2 family endonuclease [Chloroflexota bacterium]
MVIPMVLETAVKITADTFYALPEYAANEFIELIDGKVVIGVGARTKHQSIVVKCILLMGRILPQQGGQIFTSRTEVALDEFNIYEPDVLYLAPDTRCVVEEKRIVGAPELVVEVLSPSTAKIDRMQKFRAYERHGVREYWIADPANETLEVWLLRDGKFELLGIFAAGDTFDSAVLAGLKVAAAEILAG